MGYKFNPLFVNCVALELFCQNILRIQILDYIGICANGEQEWRVYKYSQVTAGQPVRLPDSHSRPQAGRKNWIKVFAMGLRK